MVSFFLKLAHWLCKISPEIGYVLSFIMTYKLLCYVCVFKKKGFLGRIINDHNPIAKSNCILHLQIQTEVVLLP